jgi:pimeloyl-ACP methyl ester carboxylesterase
MRSRKTCRLKDLDLEYVEQGSGAPVVFVHGSNADYRIWEDHLDAVASLYRTIAINQRYFGLSPWPDRGEGFGQTVHGKDLAAFIRSLDSGPATLVGWSYGGGVCLSAAVEHKALVERMFLYEPALATHVENPAEAAALHADRQAMMARAKQLSDEGDLEGSVRTFMDDVNAEGGTFNGLSPKVRELMTDNARMLPLLFAAPPPPQVTAEDLRMLEIPTTIAVGELSRNFYQIAAHKAQALIPGAKAITAKAGRHLYPVQEPALFSRLLLAFLDGE